MGQPSGTQAIGGALGSLKVADIMSVDPFVLGPHTTIGEAAHELCTRRFGGAAVVDGTQILGVISKSDLLDVVADASAPIERVMTQICFAVRPGDPAMVAVRLMLYENVHRALVVENGRLVGMVTPFDVMRALQLRDDSTFSERDPRFHSDPARAVYIDLRGERPK